MNNKTQTAVEWLWGQIKPRCDFDNVPDSILEQAKELEKQQIIDAVSEGHDYCENGKVRWIGENFYNLKYGGNK